jgi:signal peptidase I
MKISLDSNHFRAWVPLIRREGHTVDTASGHIQIDGIPATSYIVQDNYLFVVGDNRGQSYDSGSWGLLPESNVIGVAELIYWSREVSPSTSTWYDLISYVRWNRIGTIVR